MTDTFRSLCAELVDIATAHCNPDDSAVSYCAAVLLRARTALSQPEPEGPTEEEMNDLFWKHSSEIGPSVGVGLAHEDAPALICEALARWGRPAVEPESNGQT